MSKVLLCIMDGVGIRKNKLGNAYLNANTKTLDKLIKEYPHTYLEASGEYVGLPKGQMGNSEVGHSTIGSGRIIYQSLEKINRSIEDKSFYRNENILDTINYAKKNNSKLHLIGLLSDGGIHSHISHLFALIDLCSKENVSNIYIHIITDGRDTHPQSAIKYINMLEEKIKDNKNIHIATICGRYYMMDRDNNYDRVKKAYDMLDAEYRDLRFEDFNAFTDYLNLTQNIYNQFYIQGYNVEKKNDTTEFTFNNTYNMYYKILATGPMEFTVLLDDYTIETEDFKTKYASASIESKAITNADKVMKMINSKDYESIYNLLDETYRTNNFATLDSFIQYINTAFYNANYYTISNVSEQGSYYLITVTCKENASASAATKENRMIISIGEGTNFTMSFALE